MKCTNCSFDNAEHSMYCQECGTSLKKHPQQEAEFFDGKTLREQFEEIEDVIFKPKKKGSFLGKLFKLFFIAVGIGFVGVVFLIVVFAVFFPEDTASLKNEINDQVDPNAFPLGELNLEEVDSEWVGEQLHIKGILKNNYEKAAKDINLRIDFYKDKESQQLFDTRYVTLLEVSPKGAYRFNEPVLIKPYEGQFWYVSKIESAKYSEN